jgi:DNA gyrase subunit B
MIADNPQPDDILTAEETHTAAASKDYTSDDVKYLKDAEHIRQRPGMYIGDTGIRGLHHLVAELIHNSVDEALAGFCHNIHTKIHADESVSVSDDGRGIPVEMHPDIGISTLEAILTMVGVGAKFGGGAYKVSAGLHGMGAKAVTALSEWAEAQVQRNGRTYTQEYERGKATTAVKDVGASKRTGTRVHFRPDPTIFKDAKFDFDTLETRLRELAYLNRGLSFKLTDARVSPEKEISFKFDKGISEYVAWLHREEKPNELISPIISIDKTVDGIRVEVALQYTNGDVEQMRCYTNNAYNSKGGSHLTGFRTALTRSLQAYGAKQTMFEKITPTGDDFRKGLTYIISIQHPDPQFSSQTKESLTTNSVEPIVSSAVAEALSKYLEENPKEAKAIMKKAMFEAEAREAARKLKESMRDRKGLLSGGGLPGKLWDCIGREKDKCELFLVEGDSAGGSAVEGREAQFQAILPLRGKPLNVEKARFENLAKNEEIANLIKAIGIDINVDATSEEGAEALTKKLRYGKIVIMTDADVDGQHIRTLLLTFFYRQMPLLVLNGHIYVARPPLYKVKNKEGKGKDQDNVRFVATVEAMQQELILRGLKNTKLVVYPRGDAQREPSRFDGDELSSLVTRMVQLEDSLVTLERRGVSLSSFVQKHTEHGLPSHRIVIGGREHWTHTHEEAELVKEREKQRLGRDLVVENEESSNNKPSADTLFEEELLEVKKVNRMLEEVKKYGLDVKDLIPAERVAGREPPPRLRLENRDNAKPLGTLRELSAEIRKLGERGLEVVRFKGLGEMNSEELWDTTLDPEKRTVLQVQLDDAIKANAMFTTLMGDEVEPRRRFINEHALHVKEIDYHGA